MPNIITHKIFGEEVIKKLKRKEIVDCIMSQQQIYDIGCHGPDFLFFYHLKPWELWKKHDLNAIGSQLHKKGINAFYQSAIQSIRREKNIDVRQNMLVYFLGHLCHWTLDSIAHPYIFYWTGNGKGQSASYHHHMEAVIDAIVLQKYYQKDIQTYRYYEMCTINDEMLKAIVRIYIPAIQEVCQKEVKVYDIRKALNDWKAVQKMLYDPYGKKQAILMKIEKLLKKPWLITGNIIPVSWDKKYDVCNDKKRSWCHPCDDLQVSKATFFDLFQQAIEKAALILEEAYDCINYQKDTTYLLNLLDDKAYDTGRNDRKEMKYFQILYEEE